MPAVKCIIIIDETGRCYETFQEDIISDLTVTYYFRLTLWQRYKMANVFFSGT